MDQLKTFTDPRGSLTLVEVGKEVPFTVSRAYWIHHVPAGQERGKHANWTCYEYLIVVHGSVDIYLENAQGCYSYHLSTPDKGVLVPPATWTELSNFSEDAVLMVLASEDYRPETYINSYEEFLKQIGKR